MPAGQVGPDGNGSGGGGGSGTPGGSTTQVQYNDGGSFGGFGGYIAPTLNLTGQTFGPWETYLEIVNQDEATTSTPLAVYAYLITKDTADASGSLYGGVVLTPTGGTADQAALYGVNVTAGSSLGAARTVAKLYGALNTAINQGEGTVSSAYGMGGLIQAFNGVISDAYALYGKLEKSGDGAITNGYAVFSEDLTGIATNGYFLWSNSPGVYRVKDDGVMAYYNPSFTKYVPGAANFERVVQQWDTDVLEYGTEAGGTGVLRKLRLIGAGLLTDATILPTVNPNVAGQLWNDGNTVKVSTG